MSTSSLASETAIAAGVRVTGTALVVELGDGRPCLRHSTGIRDWPNGAPPNDVGGSSSVVGMESTGPTSMKTFRSKACWRVAAQWRARPRCDVGVPHVNNRLTSEWRRRGADRIAAHWHAHPEAGRLPHGAVLRLDRSWSDLTPAERRPTGAWSRRPRNDVQHWRQAATAHAQRVTNHGAAA